MLQLNAAGMPIRPHSNHVYWDEFVSVWYHYRHYGSNREEFAYDECTDHVDKCLCSVSSPTFVM